jgi:hypothetical protein
VHVLHALLHHEQPLGVRDVVRDQAPSVLPAAVDRLLRVLLERLDLVRPEAAHHAEHEPVEVWTRLRVPHPRAFGDEDERLLDEFQGGRARLARS